MRLDARDQILVENSGFYSRLNMENIMVGIFIS